MEILFSSLFKSLVLNLITDFIETSHKDWMTSPCIIDRSDQPIA